MTAIIPEGLEPLAVWDASSPGYMDGPWRERAAWTGERLGDTTYIYRVEFYVIDTAFAVVGRFIPNGDGRKQARAGGPLTETVFVVSREQNMGQRSQFAVKIKMLAARPLAQGMSA